MKKQKLRSEIDNNYKWDLTKIYVNNDEWYKDYNEVKKELPTLSRYKDIKFDSKTLYEFLCLDSNISRKLDKLYSYAHLLNDSDTTDTLSQELVGKIINLFDEYSKITTFFKPTLMNFEYSEIEEFYKENSKLKEYEILLKRLFRYKKHTLSEDEEKVVSEIKKIFSSPSNTFEKLTDADMKFGTIIDEDGNEVEFNDSNYAIYIRSKDRRVRKDAFDLLYNGYSNFKNTLASTYSSQVELECSIAHLYKYNSALEESLYDDNIDISVYENLIKTVNNSLPSIYKYFELRKRILKLDTLHMYDTYVDLIDIKTKEYSFNDAKDLVLNALSIMGEDYTSILNKAFDEHWIDVYNNVGKRGGAYSSGCYDVSPYILLNYEGRLDDVSTLAHELGHSVHSYYARRNNPYQYSGYSLFVAEVASTVNELLLNHYLLDTVTDKNERLVILNKQLELFKSTIFRQTMFAEFEKIMHEESSKGEILTHDFISNKYYELVKKYFGEDVYVDDNIKYEWSRIPHFYYNFYVYKYATGLSAASYIVTNILSGDKEYIEKYKTFLKSGDTKDPLDELKIADVDMNNKEVIESAIKIFANTLEEFEKLLNS